MWAHFEFLDQSCMIIYMYEIYSKSGETTLNIHIHHDSCYYLFLNIVSHIVENRNLWYPFVAISTQRWA